MMRILKIRLFLLLRELVPDGDIEAAHDFLHHVQGELTAFASLLHLLVIELLGGCFHEAMVAKPPLIHELV